MYSLLLLVQEVMVISALIVFEEYFYPFSFLIFILYYFFLGLDGTWFNILLGIGGTSNSCTTPEKLDSDKVDLIIFLLIIIWSSDWYGLFEQLCGVNRNIPFPKILKTISLSLRSANGLFLLSFFLFWHFLVFYCWNII